MSLLLLDRTAGAEVAEGNQIRRSSPNSTPQIDGGTIFGSVMNSATCGR
jgi:hypothetical protein